MKSLSVPNFAFHLAILINDSESISLMESKIKQLFKRKNLLQTYDETLIYFSIINLRYFAAIISIYTFYKNQKDIDRLTEELVREWKVILDNMGNSRSYIETIGIEQITHYQDLLYEKHPYDVFVGLICEAFCGNIKIGFDENAKLLAHSEFFLSMHNYTEFFNTVNLIL